LQKYRFDHVGHFVRPLLGQACLQRPQQDQMQKHGQHQTHKLALGRWLEVGALGHALTGKTNSLYFA
jgi:hypothetical protein